jgi:trans-AT polyketide synthase/acyltransferase/oxidoreductase domain-containing protein
LLSLDQPLLVVEQGGQVGITQEGHLTSAMNASGNHVLAYIPAYPIEALGDPAFMACYGTRYAYYAGAMANAIASTELVIALGRAGFLGSYGAAGMVGPRLEAAIQQIQQSLPEGPYAFNLIHSPHEEAMEHRAVELFLKYGVTCVEASAFLDLTPSIVYYRTAGLSTGSDGKIIIKNRVIAKLSRKEVALKFMQPAPTTILNRLLQENKITPAQAELAGRVPMADDITVEADSGGHTDNRPLVCLIPTMLAVRDEIQEKFQYAQPVRIGAGGGISTPASALGAFMMGAAYVVTGSVNQACLEAGASEHTKKLLAQASMADVAMAPSADMFEMGVKVQVLRNGTFFPMRAQKLYDLYFRYNSIDEIPADEREKLERQVFRRELESIWADTVKFFEERDPDQIARAASNPKRKMALIFRWYLGLSSRWSNTGEKGREMDYQIWCGPAIGPFNEWTHQTYLAEPGNRHAVDVAKQILTGAAYLYRVQSINAQGLKVASHLEQYRPLKPLV